MQPNYAVDMRLNIPTQMRDGVDLSSDIYLPQASGKFPTVLMRTPYDNNTQLMIEKAMRLANNGYACVHPRRARALGLRRRSLRPVWPRPGRF